jgi:hypothetical protein
MLPHTARLARKGQSCERWGTFPRVTRTLHRNTSDRVTIRRRTTRSRPTIAASNRTRITQEG